MFTPNSDTVLIEKIASDMAAAPQEVALGEAEEYFKYDLRPLFQEIKAPIRSINRQSRDPELVEEIRKYAPSFEIVSVPNAGHFLMIEDPDTFNRLLEEIIQDF